MTTPGRPKSGLFDLLPVEKSGSGRTLVQNSQLHPLQDSINVINVVATVVVILATEEAEEEADIIRTKSGPLVKLFLAKMSGSELFKSSLVQKIRRAPLPRPTTVIGAINVVPVEGAEEEAHDIIGAMWLTLVVLPIKGHPITTPPPVSYQRQMGSGLDRRRGVARYTSGRGQGGGNLVQDVAPVEEGPVVVKPLKGEATPAGHHKVTGGSAGDCLPSPSPP